MFADLKSQYHDHIASLFLTLDALRVLLECTKVSQTIPHAWIDKLEKKIEKIKNSIDYLFDGEYLNAFDDELLEQKMRAQRRACVVERAEALARAMDFPQKIVADHMYGSQRTDFNKLYL